MWFKRQYIFQTMKGPSSGNKCELRISSEIHYKIHFILSLTKQLHLFKLANTFYDLFRHIYMSLDSPDSHMKQDYTCWLQSAVPKTQPTILPPTKEKSFFLWFWYICLFCVMLTTSFQSFLNLIKISITNSFEVVASDGLCLFCNTLQSYQLYLYSWRIQ